MAAFAPQQSAASDSIESVDAAATAFAARYWWIPLLRGLAGVGVGLWVTLSVDHSAELGAHVFAVFALVSGLALLLAWPLVSGEAGAARALRLVQPVQGLVSIAAGLVALLVPSVTEVRGLMLLLIVWAAVSAVLELLLGLRWRVASSVFRDATFAGALTALLAIVVVFIDPAFSHEYHVVEQGELMLTGHVTADIITVGVFGAYAAILGVYLTIGAIALRFPNKESI